MIRIALTAAAMAGSMLLGGSISLEPQDLVEDYEVIEVTNGGVIKGIVLFEGDPPPVPRKSIRTSDAVCRHAPILDESLMVWPKNNGIRWTLVRIKEIPSGKAWPTSEEDRPVLDQKGCRFRPHVVTVGVDQPLKVLNNDGIMHNVHTKARRNRTVNTSMPGQVKELEMTFKRPEMMRVQCDVHDWMDAWIVVTEHPYAVVTDKLGNFKITDVPPGTYELEFWHETLKGTNQTVVVESAATVELEVTLSEKKR